MSPSKPSSHSSKSKAALSCFTLAMICFCTVANIANVPLTALYGTSSLFYLGCAALFFFLPHALISAELVTVWNESGGVYLWVRKAFGEHWGFLAIWLQWVQNIAWYPAALTFIVSTFGYTFSPALAANKYYIFIGFVIVFWSVTFLNFRGIEASGKFTSYCGTIGVIFPGIVIALLGIMWFSLGKSSQISFTWESFFPDLSSLAQLGILASLMTTAAGMEVPAVHVKDVKDPQKNYPKAILIATLLIFSIFSLAALSLAAVIPKNQIALGNGAIIGFSKFFSSFDIAWATPVFALIMSFGALGSLNSWILGPARGLFAAAERGDLPKPFAKTNKKKMPVFILVLQGVLSTLLASVILFGKNINQAYFMLYNLTAILYMLMYLLMFLAFIRIRYKYNHLPRSFKIPFGKLGAWILGGGAALVICFIIFTGFVPPAQIPMNTIFYEAYLFISVAIFVVLPFLFYTAFHKKKKIK